MNLNQEQIKQIKSAYLNGEEIDTSDISPQLLESWNRSMRAGVCKDLDCFPDLVLNRSIAANIHERMKFYNARYGHTWKKSWDLIAEIGGAVLCLNKDLSCYAKDGNPEFLAELKKKNIKFSSCFKEELMGTNAISMAMLSGEPTWVVGEEHYSDVFSGYACYGVVDYWDTPSELVNGIYPLIFMNDALNLYLIPIDKFTPHNKKIIEAVASIGAITTIMKTFPELYAANYLLDERDNASCLITDANGMITCVNSRYCKYFDVIEDMLLGYPASGRCVEIFPYIDAALSGRKTVATSIFAGIPQKEYTIDCIPMYNNSELIGTVSRINLAENVKKNINRHIAYNARFTFSDIIGNTTALQQTKILANAAANSMSTVLITGESGTGKEMFAQAIHNAGDRASKPFIAINCAAIPHELVGSELFGYVEGAFTGAKRRGAMGKFELANHGTIFLDEISEMPLDMQSALLRVLEERVVTRIGDSLPRPINVRVIAASNRNLLKYVEERKFRMDLYYRLNVIHLDIPPLRERKEDIPLLCNHIQHQFSTTFSSNSGGIDREAMGLLQAYNWPGNVRELRNVIERCLNIAQGNNIQAADLPPEFHSVPQINQKVFSRPLVQMPATYNSYEDYERAALAELMKKHNGNKTAVAKEMGVSRSKLYHLFDKYHNLKF